MRIALNIIQEPMIGYSAQKRPTRGFASHLELKLGRSFAFGARVRSLIPGIPSDHKVYALAFSDNSTHGRPLYITIYVALLWSWRIHPSTPIVRRPPDSKSADNLDIDISTNGPATKMKVDNIFDERRKTIVHIIQISLIALAIVLSIGRVTIRNPPASRANTVAITLVSLITDTWTQFFFS